MGSEFDEYTWNLCMTMLTELDEVFPYFPVPNYPWAHMMGNVICTMQRERNIYMEGIACVSEDKGDIEMDSVHEEDAVPASLPVVAETKQTEGMPVETVLQQDAAPDPLERSPPRPCIIRTYSRKAVGTARSDTKGSAITGQPRPAVQKVILRVNDPAPPVSPSSVGPPVPPLPSPSGGDHSLDRDYLEEHPLHIWVNLSRSHQKLHMDRQHLDDQAVRV